MFPLQFDGEIRAVTKIQAGDFTPDHRDQLAQASFQAGRLLLPDARWASLFLGAGEEKAVFCVCDHANRVFAVEALDERTYVDGRFVGGQYFFDMRVPGLSGARLRPDSTFGLMFSGKIRVREFVHGYEWARFRFDPRRRSLLDPLLTSFLRAVLAYRFDFYRTHYRDVHARNVLFELRALSEKGVPVLVRNWTGAFRLVRVGLQAVDVR
ncbi:MAG: hypothetical protein JXJ20_00475 [Anaerolineae bacterium]|nr:hypothetical protein [Anaerolineae bacterium]